MVIAYVVISLFYVCLSRARQLINKNINLRMTKISNTKVIISLNIPSESQKYSSSFDVYLKT